jgi:DNA-binding transcriptional regulator YiaG
MPNIASMLKEEISRIARKEIRREIAGLRKAVTTYRTEIAALKRRSIDLERSLRRAVRRQAPRAQMSTEGSPNLRFSPKGLAALRKRLDLSAADFGRLLGASGQSIYLWESGKMRPTPKHLAGIAAIRGLGKRAVAERLEALRG